MEGHTAKFNCEIAVFVEIIMNPLCDPHSTLTIFSGKVCIHSSIPTISCNPTNLQ